jgi:hypothetical protein
MCSIFSIFVGCFLGINQFNYKANQIYLKQTKTIQDVILIHCKKIDCSKIIHVTTIGGAGGGAFTFMTIFFKGGE